MATTMKTDRVAVALSAACIAHCLALPALALILPVAGAIAEIEAIHVVFAVLAIVASASVPIRSADGRTPRFLIPATIGIVLIISALFAEPLGLDETLSTVCGGLVLSFAHLRRLRAHHNSPSEAS